MKRLFIALVLCSLPLSFAVAQKRRAIGKPVVTPAPQNPRWFNDPLDGVTADERFAFDRGREVFDKFQKMSDGLGPVFNGRACSECHNLPTLGGHGYRGTTLIGAWVGGKFDPLTKNGGPDLQGQGLSDREKATHTFNPERSPGNATVTASRRTPGLFGLGLVEATPDATFLALAADQKARKPAMAGRAAIVDNIRTGTKTVGRFGAKAQIATLSHFVAFAELSELGMTNPDFPNENCPSGNCAELAHNPRPDLNDTGGRVRQIVNFLTMLGAPPRGEIDADVLAGEKLFARLECDFCHVPALKTGPNQSRALSNVTYQPYSDFLLHDMDRLGDQLQQGDAGPREMRTMPLWGIRMKIGVGFLHDGRARTIDEAIIKHEGQGASASAGYRALTAKEREQVVAFLRSL
ncbi:MAG TPA: di-heme oxidoredictase family protein [Thermoanaerobaculia bacterium]|nr:di-heme oxidoredictase family protein [Thermoanaerobaculia bacterium]